MDDGFYLYCVVPAGHEPPESLRGIEDERVVALPAAGLVLWATARPRPPAPSVEAIRRHNAVVEAAMTADVTPVPLRFGQFLGGHAAVLERAAERAGEWRRLLDEFAGREEHGVRVVDPALTPAARDVHAAASTGRAYLQALARATGEERARAARAQAIADDLGTRLGGLIAQQRVEPLPSAHGLASIAHLVRRADAAAYRNALDAATAAHPSLRFLTSGPWPPYSFAA
jgi:hypothetical protein